MNIIKGILLQCVDPVSCITSHCLYNALHKQLNVLQSSFKLALLSNLGMYKCTFELYFLTVSMVTYRLKMVNIIMEVRDEVHNV